MFRILVRCVLLSIAFAVPLSAQDEEREDPVTKREVGAWLRFAPDTPAGIEEANQELIDAIKARGVDFVLSPVEEWSLQLQDASDELIKTIREAHEPEERERLLKRSAQQGISNAFLTNYKRPDLTSRSIAVAAGREFIHRYKNDADVRDIVELMQKSLPTLERSIRGMSRPARGRIRTN